MSNEALFQARLVARLLELDWTVYEQVYCRSRFGNGYIDIYASPPETWKYKHTFPTLAIECKGKDVGTGGEFIHSATQVERYVASFDFKKERLSLPRPSIFLLATHTTLTAQRPKDGLIYDDPLFYVERFLWKEGGALLRCLNDEIGFSSNIGTSTRWFKLFTKRVTVDATTATK